MSCCHDVSMNTNVVYGPLALSLSLSEIIGKNNAKMSLCGVWIKLGNERFRHLEIGFKLANQRMSVLW